MGDKEAQRKVLMYAHIQTLAMKAVQYSSSARTSIGVGTIEAIASLHEAICYSHKHNNIIHIESELLRLDSSIAAYERLEDTTCLIAEQPVLYYYLTLYRPDRFRIWSSLPEEEMYHLYAEHNALHLYGLMRCDLLTKRKRLPSLPYTINELTALKEYKYFSHLENLDKFIFTPFVGISNAHICHCISAALACRLGNGNKEIYFISIPEVSANTEHTEILRELVDEARLFTFSQLLSGYTSKEVLPSLALYCDRVSILSAGLQISKYKIAHNVYLSQYKRLVGSEEYRPLKEPSLIQRVDDKIRCGLVLIHCRDSRYKGQAHLGYRDSDIRILESAIVELGLNKKCCRIGVSGNHLSDSRIIDAPRQKLKLRESWLFIVANLFISSSSGPGHFASEFYGVSSILVNCTTLVVGDCVRKDKVIALKHIVPSSIKSSNEIEFVSDLLNDWNAAKFHFVECTKDELKRDITSARNSFGITRLCDLSNAFGIMLGNLSEQMLTDRCANNLAECLKLIRKREHSLCYGISVESF